MGDVGLASRGKGEMLRGIIGFSVHPVFEDLSYSLNMALLTLNPKP